MIRSTTCLTLVVALAIGCKREKPAPAGPPGADGTTGAPGTQDAPLAILPADLPRITPREKFKLPGERVYRDAVQLSDDGRTLATAYRTPQGKHVVQVYDLSAKPKVVAEFEGSAFALSPSGKRVYTSDRAEVYDVASKKPLARVASRRQTTHVFFRDEDRVVGASRSYDFDKPAKGRITLWDVAGNADAGSFDTPDDRFSDALWTNSRKEFWLFMSAKKFEVECYDVDARKLARTIRPETDDPKRPYQTSGIWPSISPDGTAFASNVSRMRIYDAAGKIVGGLPPALWDSPAGLIPGGTGGRYLARVSLDASKATGLPPTTFVIYAWKNSRSLAALTGPAAAQEEFFPGVSGDGRTAVIVSKAGEGLVFDLSGVR